MMKQFFLATFFLFVFSQSVAQQQQPVQPTARPAFDWSKVFVGGNMGLQFGTITLVNISPLIGYKITDRLSAGITTTYIYYKYNTINFSSSIYGAGVFARLNILENVFGHAEYEVLNVDSYDFPGTRTNIENIFVGGGFSQPIGANSSYTIMALWNLGDSKYSPYSNPILRMGFNIGF